MSTTTNETAHVSSDVQKPLAFQAGRLKDFLSQWQKITSDPFILQMVKGAHIPLVEDPDEFDSNTQNQIEGNQRHFMDMEVQKLLEIGVIERTHHEEGEVISPVFLVDKSDGSYRMILNLKKFNEKVEYEHFKMENLMSATQMMTQGCYLASVDFRSAYYTVSIDPAFRKFLKFQWNGNLYAYTCFANGLAHCPRYFTKLLKPVYAKLRSQGHLSAAFIDDCCLLGETYQECKKNISDTVHLFQSLGFVIHDEKSVLEPCRRLKYLGVWLDSESMTVTLTEKKKEKLKLHCEQLKKMKRFSIRFLAQAIGLIVSSFSAVLWGPLFYRGLDRLKINALRESKGDFEAEVQLSVEADAELDWWISEIDHAFYPLDRTQPDIVLKTDASHSGYGSVCQSTKAGGRWSKSEQQLHINVLELKAIENGLRSFEDVVTGKHIKLLTDNTCALAYIRDMGGSKSRECNDVANRVWKWCKERNVWLTIAHIPGKKNTEADEKSRKFDDRTEWQLNPKFFQFLTKELGQPDIELFASKLNCQLQTYISWHRDPDAVAVDAFSVDWGQWNFIYVFAPFSLAMRVLSKWRTDCAEGMIILPHWPTAPWFPVMLRMLVDQPVLLPKGRRTLRQAHSDEPHPLYRKMQLVACVLSGNPTKAQVFRQKLYRSSCRHGESPRRDSTILTFQSGEFSAIDGVSIPCRHL